MVTTCAVDDHQVSDNTFGLFIAYVLPGFVALYGLPVTQLSGAGWSLVLANPDPSVTELLLLTVQAVTVGLIVSAIRWITIDAFHHLTGLRAPNWNFAALDHGVAVMELLIQIHYRYYKFYANMVVALVWSFLTRGSSLGWRSDLCYGTLTVLFFFASRDTLRKYYARTSSLFDRG